jgi:hypothetical protein
MSTASGTVLFAGGMGAIGLITGGEIAILLLFWIYGICDSWSAESWDKGPLSVSSEVRNVVGFAAIGEPFDIFCALPDHIACAEVGELQLNAAGTSVATDGLLIIGCAAEGFDTIDVFLKWLLGCLPWLAGGALSQ